MNILYATVVVCALFLRSEGSLTEFQPGYSQAASVDLLGQ
ncbi:Uncharacterised protein [Jonesia denitrificans]|nr:Uncharacterised protein [Jonesia denitrificans]